MDIGEIRHILQQQYIDATCDIANGKRGRRFRRAVEQVGEDIKELDNIMMRNFGMGYNPDIQIYE